MYKSKRTRRNSKLYRKIGLCAFACVSLISCSTPQKQGSVVDTSSNKVQAHKLLSRGLCKEFKGRGRLEFGRTKERFTYNAILNKDTFSLAIDVPFKPQETLVLPFDLNKSNSGSLYQKTSQGLARTNRVRTKSVLDNFLMKNRKLFSDIRKIDSNSCDDNCLAGRVEKFGNDKVVFHSKMDGPYEFKAEFSRLVANEYKFIQLHGIQISNNPKKTRRVLSLDLIVDSCDSI